MRLLQGDRQINETSLCRRSFMKYVLFSGIATLVPNRVWSAIDDHTITERTLSLYNPNTKESLCTTYWENGAYVTDALEAIDHFLRDQLTGQEKSIDTKLLDLLYAMKTKLDTERPFYVISGYRSPKTNALLRRRGRPAAKNSFHLQGKAVDIYMPGYKLSALHRTSTQLHAGGVGYYPRHGFVHIDVGPIRYWAGN